MIQYTIRNIPDYIDKIVRKKAEKSRKSINSVIIETLKNGLNADNEIIYHDMDDLAGTWIDDPEIDSVLAEFNNIDTEIWK